MVDPAPGYRIVGRVVRAHGIHGAVIVDPLTNQPGRFDPGARLLLGPSLRPATVVSATPYKGRLLVRFAEIGERDEAEAASRQDLRIAPEDVGEPPPGEVWAADLEGLPVTDGTGTPLGTVTAVLANPAHDILAVADPEGREFLVPMVAEFVDPVLPGIDRIVLHPIPGLLPDGTEEAGP